MLLRKERKFRHGNVDCSAVVVSDANSRILYSIPIYIRIIFEYLNLYWNIRILEYSNNILTIYHSLLLSFDWRPLRTGRIYQITYGIRVNILFGRLFRFSSIRISPQPTNSHIRFSILLFLTVYQRGEGVSIVDRPVSRRR